jgi:hypothetical protein
MSITDLNDSIKVLSNAKIQDITLPIDLIFDRMPHALWA